MYSLWTNELKSPISMFDNRLLEKWWFRAFLAICIFLTWQLFYSISNVQNLWDEKSNLEATIEFLKRKSDYLRMEIHEKERKLVRLDKKAEDVDFLIKDHLSLLPRSNRTTEIPIYFITPTNFRSAQKADLTRLSYTLSHVPNLHWIVVEDSDKATKGVRDVLIRSKVKFTHLSAETPAEQKMKYNDPNWYLPRGVDQRNAALSWIRNQLAKTAKGVVYFGDDDNTYDLRLFDEMRKVRKAGVWPVGIVGGLLVESPILSETGSITKFNSVWKPERPFPIDMAAFAVNVSIVMENPDAAFSYNVPRGYQESTFLEKLGITRFNMEPLALNCTKVYVWHTRTEKSVLSKQLIEKVRRKSGFDFLEADALGADNE